MQKLNLDNNEYFFKKVDIKNKYNFYEFLSIMLDGGISIIKAIESVESKLTSNYFKQQIKLLLIFIKNGDQLSKSMKKIPSIFNKYEISLVEAGELSGNLNLTLMKLSDDLKKKDDLQKKIIGVLIYPSIIFLFLFLALFIVLTFVIPEIKQLFETASDIELPLSTRMLIGSSDFFINNITLIFLFFFSIIVLFLGFLSTEPGKRSIEEILFSIPLIGQIYKNYILANIASNLSSLIGSGVSIINTFKLVGKSTNSVIYESLINNIITNILEGKKIVESIELSDPQKIYFPSDYTQMLLVGENTASIDILGAKLEKQYNKEVDYSLSNLTKWIEPVAIIIASIFVLWFAYSIIGAILMITQTVG